ncbi:hypothetical protein [Streptomyces sp. Root1310]|uniref:hypothetical protein n=1 Tax=Streptomyces sp. Root1310 TaxID=1736452 RepID=UPI000AF66F3A|nr:hypothetical protein [Streptomyces sp. Root1310]
MRAADLRFVLDQLTVLERGGNPDAEGSPLPRGLRGTLDLTRVGAFGHSRGGAASAAVMYLDERVRAGIDLDGALDGPVVEHGLDLPFLLMDTAVHDGLNEDGSWPPFWAHLSDWHRCLRLADADHNSFTDIVAIAPQVPESVREALQIGTIPADRGGGCRTGDCAGLLRSPPARPPGRWASAVGGFTALPRGRVHSRIGTGAGRLFGLPGTSRRRSTFASIP